MQLCGYHDSRFSSFFISLAFQVLLLCSTGNFEMLIKMVQFHSKQQIVVSIFPFL